MAFSLDEISEMWAEDGPINNADINGQSSEIPKLHNKYFKIFNLEKARLKKVSLQHKQLVRLKTEYYLGILDEETLAKHNWKACELRVLRTDLPIYIDSDDDIINSLLRIEAVKIKVDFLDSIIKMINVRGIQIRGIIDWSRFQAGINGK